MTDVEKQKGTQKQGAHKGGGWFVFLCFFAFFGVIVAVNGVFIYNALGTHSGVVTAQPYEKGLAYNTVLEEAAAQPNIEHQVSYEGGALQWALPVDDAVVGASFVRPVQDGYDFEVTLAHVGGGVYEVRPEMPLSGAWTVKLKAQWANEQFQTHYQFIAP